MNKLLRYGLDSPSHLVRGLVIGIGALFGAFYAAEVLSDNFLSILVVTLLATTAGTFLIPVMTISLGSLFFKFRERDWLFEKIVLRGDEHVLDVGCGHGLLLIAAAKRLSSGRAVGLDRWVQVDQALNSRSATLENAQREGVESRVEVVTGDAREMPFADSSFDVVVSSWALHNIAAREDRERALAEIVRVLKPDGRVAVLDIERAFEYAAYFQRHGFRECDTLGPRYTFGNRTYLVLGKKC